VGEKERNRLEKMQIETLRTRMKKPSKILLLDGGISTELEKSLAARGSGTSNDDDDDDDDDSGACIHTSTAPVKFPDRNLWSSSLLLSHKGRLDIQSRHENFLAAGSNIITTVTYQLSHFATRFGYTEEQIDDLLLIAIHQAKAAAASFHDHDHDHAKPKGVDEKTFIVASIGCYGAVLADGSEYTGDYQLSVDDLMQFHQRRLEVLSRESNQIDGIAFETIPSLIEVRAILKLLKLKTKTKTKPRPNQDEGASSRSGCNRDVNGAVWLSLACQNGSTLNDGTSISEVLQVLDLEDPNSDIVHGIGVNCCKVGFVHELSLLLARHILDTRTSTITDSDMKNLNPKAIRTIVLYPNSGEDWDAVNNCWEEGSGCTIAEDFANEMLRCIRSIHNLCREMDRPLLPVIVGGCCRTTPSTIWEMRRKLNQYACDEEFIK